MIKPLDLAVQLTHLLRIYPDAMCWLQAEELHWHGTLQPTPVSRCYRVHITYRRGQFTPECRVIDPGLHRLVAESFRPGRKLPHVYTAAGDPLCLFLGENEWNAGMSIAETTVPWASLWLRFFEIWLATNTWEGSGAAYHG